MTAKKKIKAVRHPRAKRKNIPTAETTDLVNNKVVDLAVAASKTQSGETAPVSAPILNWHGRDVVDRAGDPDSAPLYVQERVQPLAIISELQRHGNDSDSPPLFEDWHKELSDHEKFDFYAHAHSWENRLILGDSHTVMRSLSDVEGLDGSVQCVYFDPPYGINFRSNWQPTTKRGVVPDNEANQTREPEVFKAFCDTWKEGLNSYMSYIHERLLVMRQLLAETGSIFVQIGEENVHYVRCLLDEVFGPQNFYSQITFRTKSPLATSGLPSISSYLLWYAKDKQYVKYRPLYQDKKGMPESGFKFARDKELRDYSLAKMDKNDKNKPGLRLYTESALTSSGWTPSCAYTFELNGKSYSPERKTWTTNKKGMENLLMADRVIPSKKTPKYRRYYDDFAAMDIDNVWRDTGPEYGPIYVVQTNKEIVKRCLLMASDPGDLILDPTCGSGTTAAVAEEWGRRWITIDTSRIAVSLARARLIGNSYPYYVLHDSDEGRLLRGEVANQPAHAATVGSGNNKIEKCDINMGFVYESKDRVTIRRIGRIKAIPEVYNKWAAMLDPLRLTLSEAAGMELNEWDMPRPENVQWPEHSKKLLAKWWKGRIKRQEEIDALISASAEKMPFYDRPRKNKKIVRVTGPFTVETIMPYRSLSSPASNDGDNMNQDHLDTRPSAELESEAEFHKVIHDHLLEYGIENTKRKQRIVFTLIETWQQSEYIEFQGRYDDDNGIERKAAICVGPEYGTIDKLRMKKAIKHARGKFDLLVLLGFAFDPHADEGLVDTDGIQIVRVRIHNDMHVADRLKKTKDRHLFVIIGEPDIEIETPEEGMLQVSIKGIDIFDPTTGQLRSNETKEISSWMIDTNYSGKVFIPRHVYFCGDQPDPYKKLKRDLKAEICEEAWESVYSTRSRKFVDPTSGYIAVKAINTYGDEVLKICKIDKTV